MWFQAEAMFRGLLRGLSRMVRSHASVSARMPGARPSRLRSSQSSKDGHALAGCGRYGRHDQRLRRRGGSSAADFCSQIQTMSVKFAALQDNPTKSLVAQAASAAQGLAGSDPSAISSAVKTQANAIAAWAKTGVPPNALGTGSYGTANDQINAWTSANCKQSG
ncbi:MAG TPA: hypothetical protein VGM53_19505 [Streptosporangiaceae bacterium]|jgi:hypothetical protein